MNYQESKDITKIVGVCWYYGYYVSHSLSWKHSNTKLFTG